MKTVRCISPHGGCHNGMLKNGSRSPVFALPDGTIPELGPELLHLPPNPGGYVEDGRIPGRYAAVGQVYDVPDDFYADGFHWEEESGGATVTDAAQSPQAAADTVPASTGIAANPPASSTTPPPPATEDKTAGE